MDIGDNGTGVNHSVYFGRRFEMKESGRIRELRTDLFCLAVANFIM